MSTKSLSAWMRACSKLTVAGAQCFEFPALVWKQKEGQQVAKLGPYVIWLDSSKKIFEIKTNFEILKTGSHENETQAKAWAAYWCLSEVRKMEKELLRGGLNGNQSKLGR